MKCQVFASSVCSELLGFSGYALPSQGCISPLSNLLTVPPRLPPQNPPPPPLTEKSYQQVEHCDKVKISGR